MSSHESFSVLNGHADAQDLEHNTHKPPRRGNPNAFKQRAFVIIEEFSFMWFAISMNTGILSILMHQLPYQFNGLGVLSTILFLFNLVLFITLCTVLLLRVIWFPRAIIESCSSNISELSMVGGVPIALFTIVAQIGLTASTASWGGYSFFLFAYVMWWIGTALMLSVALLVFVATAKTAVTDSKSLSPALVVPFVGTATNAVVGALVVSDSTGVSYRLAIPVIVVSYMLVGVGFFAAMIIFAVFFLRLMNTGLPPPAQSPGLVLLVGPCGQSASAMLLLGSAASTYFGEYDRGTFLTTSSGTIVSNASVLMALMFVGLGFFFMLFALYIMAAVAFQGGHKYSLIWWSTIFPIATVNTALTGFATAMDSPTFRVLAAIFLVALLIDYFINWGFTLWHISTGKLLNGRKEDRHDD